MRCARSGRRSPPNSIAGVRRGPASIDARGVTRERPWVLLEGADRDVGASAPGERAGVSGQAFHNRPNQPATGAAERPHHADLHVADTAARLRQPESRRTAVGGQAEYGDLRAEIARAQRFSLLRHRSPSRHHARDEHRQHSAPHSRGHRRVHRLLTRRHTGSAETALPEQHPAPAFGADKPACQSA